MSQLLEKVRLVRQKNEERVDVAVVGSIGEPKISPTIARALREGNLAADWMAKLGCLIRSLATFSTSFSPEFSSILGDDHLDRTLERRDA